MTNEQKQKYDEYLTNHIANVSKGYDWLNTYLPDLITKSNILDVLNENITMHDRSKYSDEEYVPYIEYFYGTKSKQVEIDFNYAWLHHIHNNPHHWQYWVLKHDDEPEEALEMPYEYIIEMFCDHWSFSWKTGNLGEIFDWYSKHKDMVLHPKTRKIYENILNKVKTKLLELDLLK